MTWFPANGTKSQADDNYVLNILKYVNELKLNESLDVEQLKCLELEHEQNQNTQQEQGCQVNWDTILCWPRTPPDTLAIISCFDELNGIPYDNTRE